MNRSIFMLAAVALVVGSTNAAAQGTSKSRPASSQKAAGQTAIVVFRDADRPTFRDYFRTHSIVASPLPPGIAKNVLRGKPLPPGIAKKALPPHIIIVAPHVGPNVTFILVGDRVVAYRDGIVLDIILVL